MAQFEKNGTFIAFDGMPLAKDRPAIAGKVTEHVSKRIVEGKLHTVRPLLEDSISQVVESFRSMQDGKVMGRIVLSISDDVVPTYLETHP